MSWSARFCRSQLLLVDPAIPSSMASSIKPASTLTLRCFMMQPLTTLAGMALLIRSIDSAPSVSGELQIRC